MKTSEFIKRYGDRDLNIRIKVENESIGPTPTVGIESALPGFDWDNGNLILIPDKQLLPLPCKPKQKVYFTYNRQIEEGIVEGFTGKNDEVIIYCKKQNKYLWSSYRHCYKTYEEAEANRYI